MYLLVFTHRKSNICIRVQLKLKTRSVGCILLIVFRCSCQVVSHFSWHDLPQTLTCNDKSWWLVTSVSLDLCLTLQLCSRRENLCNGFLISAKAVCRHTQSNRRLFIYLHGCSSSFQQTPNQPPTLASAPKPLECTNPKADRRFYLPTERLVTFTKGSGQIWWNEVHGCVTLINGVEYKYNIMRGVAVVCV